MIILLIKMAFLLSCLCGIMMFFHYRHGVQEAFAPLFAVSFIISVLFAGGLLNILRESVMVVYAFGFLSFIFYLHRILSGKENIKFLFSIQTIFFFGMSLFFIWYMRDMIFHISDELSHWGTMMKEMCSLQGFPDARTVIDYKEYPPAAALAGYYFMALTGFSESICYMGQAVFTLSGVTAILFNSSWKKPVQTVCALLSMNILMWASQTLFTSLLVDYLMPLMATALVIYTFENEQQLKKHPLYFAALTSPVYLAVCLIKTNAIVLYGLYLIIVLSIIFTDRKSFGVNTNKDKARFFAWYLMPFGMLFLWKKYIDKVYLGNGYATVKFAMTKENLLKNYYEKPAELIERIISDLMRNMVTHNFFKVIAVLCIAIIILCILVKVKDADVKHRKIVVVMSVVSWVIYMIGYGCMLVFLMPKWEFDSFGYTMIGLSRYVGSIAGFCIGTQLYCLLKLIDKGNSAVKGVKGSAIGAVVCAVLIVGFRMSPAVYIHAVITPEMTSIHEFESRVDKTLFNREDHILFYVGDINEDESWINNFHLKRSFLNRNIYVVSNDLLEGIPFEYTDERFAYYLNKVDYVIRYTENENFDNLFISRGIDIIGEKGIVYEIVRDGMGKVIALNTVKQ